MGLVETIIGTTEQVYEVGAVGYVRWGRCGWVDGELRGSPLVLPNRLVCGSTYWASHEGLMGDTG